MGDNHMNSLWNIHMISTLQLPVSTFMKYSSRCHALFCLLSPGTTSAIRYRCIFMDTLRGHNLPGITVISVSKTHSHGCLALGKQIDFYISWWRCSCYLITGCFILIFSHMWKVQSQATCNLHSDCKSVYYRFLEQTILKEEKKQI